MLAMLRDVLTAIRGVTVFEGVLLVSRSKRAQVLARDFDTNAFMESAGSDHSRAVTEGNRYLEERYRAECSLVISSDVPRVTAEDIHRIIEGHDRVTLVPNASDEGTNAVLTSPPNAINYHFGHKSLMQHVASAQATGISPSIVRLSNLAHDIDSPHDLEQANLDLPSSFTRNYLQSSGIAARLNRRRNGQSNGIPHLRSTAWT